MAHPQTHSPLGMAIFSTRGGKDCQRQRTPGMSLVIRSDPNDDRDTMAARLQAQFPAICKNITTFDHRTDNYVNDYFDDYDQHLQGTDFLRAVLLHIAQCNALRARKVQDLLSRWMATNTEAFALLGPEHSVEHVFTTEDIEQYEMGLLEETLMQIQQAAALQSDFRLQEQHHPTLHGYTDSVLSQVPDSTTIPSQLPGFPTLRVTSNPEKSQARQWQEPTGQISQPFIQFPTLQGRYPQQRLPSSAVVMEHHLESTNHGELYSDPTMNILNSSYVDHGVAIPFWGLPSSYSYGSHNRGSLPERQRNYNSGAPPKGKKNPAKKSSDDARKPGSGGSSRRQSSNRRSSENYCVPVLAESLPFSRPLCEGEVPNMQIGPASQNGVRFGHPVINPHLSQPEGVMVQGGSLRTVDSGQDPQYRRPQHPIQAHGFNMQPLGPRAFGYQTAYCEPASQVPANLTAGDRLPRQTSVTDNRQLQHQQAPVQIETRVGKRMERERVTGTKIWVGHIPTAFNKAMIEDLLKPCRGLQSFIEPRTSSQKSNTYTCVFAIFGTQDEADEALDRLPRTHFNCLGEGNFLKTNWPFAYDSNRYQNQSTCDARVDQNTGHNSPVITRTGKVIDGTFIGEAREEATHHQDEMVSPRVVLEAEDRRKTVTDATGEGSANPPELDVSQAQSMTVPEPGSMDPAGVSTPTNVFPNSATMSVEDKKTAYRACQVETPASALPSPCDSEEPTVDGINDSFHVLKPKVHMEQELHGPNSRQFNNVQTLSTTATENLKKSDQISQSTDKSQNVKGSQDCRAVSLPENTKPTISTQTKTTSEASTFLVEAAHPDTEDGAANSRTVEVAVATSVATPGPPHPTPTTPHAQELTNSPILATQPKKASHQAWPGSMKQASAPIIDSPKQLHPASPEIKVELPTEPLSNTMPRYGKQEVAGTVNVSNSAEGALESSQSPCLHSPPEEEQEVAAQMMSRGSSNSTDVEDSGESMYHLSTAPTSYLQTERSNSLAEGSRASMHRPNESSPVTQRRSGGVDPEQLRSILQTDIKATIGAGHVVELNKDTVNEECLTSFAPDMSNSSQEMLPNTTPLQKQGLVEIRVIDKDTKDWAPQFLHNALQGPEVIVPPHISAKTIDSVESPGQKREQRVVIPARSSSLPQQCSLIVNPAPVLTRHKKKKSKNATKSVPAEEKGGSSGLLADLAAKQPVDEGEQTKLSLPVLGARAHQSRISNLERKKFDGAQSLTIERGVCSSISTRLSDLPEPETPFRLDGEADSLVVSDRRQRDSQESRPVAEYSIVVQSNDCRQCVVIQSQGVEKNATELPRGLREVIEDAGYLTTSAPSSARHFAVKDPILARLGDIIEQEEQSNRDESKDEIMLFSDRGKNLIMDRAEMQKQTETRAFLERAAAGKRLEESLPRTPTKNSKGKGKTGEDSPPIKSLRDRIQKIAVYNMVHKATRGERNVGDSLQDRIVMEGRILLDTSPTYGSSKEISLEWFSRAEQYIEVSEMPNIPSPSIPTTKSKTGDFHQPSTSLIRSLQMEGKLPEGSPIVTTKSGTKTPVIKLMPGEDASEIAADHLANPKLLFGTDNIKLSSLEEIHAAFEKPGGAMTRLSSEKHQALIPAQSELLKKEVVGYWNRNSGYKDSDVQDELWDEESEGIIARSQNENGVSDIQARKPSEKRPKVQDIGASIEPISDQASSGCTSQDQCEGDPGHVCDTLDMLAVVAVDAHADDQKVDDLASSPKTITGDYPDAEAKNGNPILGNKSGDTAESRQDDAEYPVLPRGRSSPMKGGESRAPSKGGYAAAARKSVEEKRENEGKGGKKRGEVDVKKDPWAPEDVWGPGKSDLKGAGVGKGGMRRGG